MRIGAIVVASSILSISSCSMPSVGALREEAVATDAPPAPKPGFVAGRMAADDAQHGGDPNVQVPADGRRMVYRAALGIEVARVDEAIEKFLATVRGLGGHLSQRVDGTVTVRVPAARFDETLAAARSHGRVLHQNLQASDVTKEYLDLELRIANTRKSRERLLALMEKADKVEDLLKIEEQLRRLTTELEQMEGELKWLADQVAMTTVEVGFQAVAAAGSPRRRVASRFEWINQVGLESMRRDF